MGWKRFKCGDFLFEWRGVVCVSSPTGRGSVNVAVTGCPSSGEFLMTWLVGQHQGMPIPCSMFRVRESGPVEGLSCFGHAKNEQTETCNKAYEPEVN